MATRCCAFSRLTALRRLALGALTHLQDLSVSVALPCRALAIGEAAAWVAAERVAARALAPGAISELHNLRTLSFCLSHDGVHTPPAGGVQRVLGDGVPAWELPVALRRLSALELRGVRLAGAHVDESACVQRFWRQLRRLRLARVQCSTLSALIAQLRCIEDLDVSALENPGSLLHGPGAHTVPRVRAAIRPASGMPYVQS